MYMIGVKNNENFKFNTIIIKIPKAKAKLTEFEIDKQDYPKFRADSEDLFYFTIYIISRYSECIVCGDETTASV